MATPTLRLLTCDACRSRKIRCNGQSPQCSFCVMSDRECQYSIPRKRGPKRGRRGQSVVTDTMQQQAATPPISEIRYMSPNTISTPSVQTELLDIADFHQSSTLHEGDGPSHQLYLTALTRLFATASCDLPSLASSCIDTFIKLLFPILPIIHEQTLRSLCSTLNAGILIQQNRHGGRSIAVPDPQSPNVELVGELGFRSRGEDSETRSIALLSAVCAEVGYMLPAHMCPDHVVALAPLFLEVSRAALGVFQDLDLGSPDSTSLAIRYMQCNCTHAVGRTQASLSLMGETVRLALAMRLHDEHSYTDLPSIEVQLRRNLFWQIFTGDKSSAILNNNIFVINSLTMGDPITVRPPDPHHASLLENNQAEQTITLGFNLCQQLFYYASELLLETRIAARYSSRYIDRHNIQEPHRSLIVDMYLGFMTALDDAPEAFRSTEFSTVRETRFPTAQQIQTANLLVTRHCLELILVQQCVRCGLAPILGLPDDEDLLDLRRLEIAGALVRILQQVPFEALRINGEPSNEKIRQVGACLLEIASKSTRSSLVIRARADFDILLDVLSRLDSRASQALLDSTADART